MGISPSFFHFNIENNLIYHESGEKLVKLLYRLKGEVHTLSILKYVNVLKKFEWTKKNAGQKLFSFSYSRASKSSISRHIFDDVTGCRRQFFLYNSLINHWKEMLVIWERSVIKCWKLAPEHFNHREIR